MRSRVTGFSQFGAQPSSPQFQNPTIFNPKVNFTWFNGKPSMKFGYEYQAINTQVNDYNPSYGQDNYAGQYSAATGTPSDTGPSSNSCCADFSRPAIWRTSCWATAVLTR